MPRPKVSPLDRVLGRLDDLDSVNLTILVQRLARERKFLETVFNTIRDGVLVVDETGVVHYGNRNGLRIAGLDDQQLGRAILWKHMPELHRSIDPHFFENPGRLGVLTREIETSYPEIRNLRVYVVPLEESFGVGRDNSFAMVFTDVTEERVQTQEVIESEKIKSIMTLAAGVAHELGNPLNSITIHLQLIQREMKKLGDSPTAQKIEKSLAVCHSEVARLDNIITHFLGAIRPRPPDFQDVNLIHLLEEVLEVQEGILKNAKISIDVDIRDSMPSVKADPNLIKQVFFNLIKNAMEAMEPGGKLKIGSRSDDEFVFLAFADTGKGIQREDIPKVFEPYFSTKQEGHGLGMMVVQRIMRDHGAQIGIDSRPGVGTVVTLQFPQKNRRIRMLAVDD
jgi:two-component system, sporulation sensor kinase E